MSPANDAVIPRILKTYEADILEECVDELFAPEGYWGRAAASHARTDGTRVAGSLRRSEEA